MTDRKGAAPAGLRDSLSRANADLVRIAPILSHLLAAPDNTLFSDEILARIRGMCHDLAWQILRAQGEAAGQSGRDAFADRHGEALAEHFYTSPALLAHCHGLAIEWQLSERLEVQFGIDPVLSPQVQELIASNDSAISSAAMAALAAQARFAQSQRRMELPLAELPADLFHDLLTGWRSYNGELRSDAMIRAEAKLRNGFDEANGRLALLARLVSATAKSEVGLLEIDRAGVSLFATALAARSGQPRVVALLSTNERQVDRLALGLRAAGLPASEIEAQVIRLHADAVPPRGMDEISPGEAGRMLSEAGTMGFA